MSLYEGIKDVASVLQKADNIELYKQLLDLGKEALSLQQEVSQLQSENKELKKAIDLEDKIIRHTNERAPGERHPDYPYITLKDETPEIRYCALCWGKHHKLIQLYDNLNCYVCESERQ